MPDIFAWMRVADGAIAQQRTAGSPADLFEMSGFGAVDTHRPIKGYLAVRVMRTAAGELVAAPAAEGSDVG